MSLSLLPHVFHHSYRLSKDNSMNGVAMNGKHQPTTGVHPHHLESLVSPVDPRDRASLVSPRLPVTLRIGVDTGHGLPTLPRRRASLERAVPRVASRRRRQAIHGEDGALLLHGAVRRPLASLVRVAALAPASLVRVADQALLPLMILGRVDRAVTVHPHRLLASLVRVAALAPASLVRVADQALLPLAIHGADGTVADGVHHRLLLESLVRVVDVVWTDGVNGAAHPRLLESLVRVADQALLPPPTIHGADGTVADGTKVRRPLASLVRVVALAPASLVRVLPLMILGMVEEDASVTHGVHHPSGDHLAVQSLVREARAREVSQAVMMESG